MRTEINDCKKMKQITVKKIFIFTTRYLLRLCILESGLIWVAEISQFEAGFLAY